MAFEWHPMENRMALNLNAKDVTFNHEMVALLLEIEEFKGSWQAYGKCAPAYLAELQRIATIESIGSSTRIEGAKCTDRDVSRMMTKRASQSFLTKDEKNVAGYACLMHEILSSWKVMPLTEHTIKHLHATLMQFSQDSRHHSTDKPVDNHVVAFDAHGQAFGVVLETVNANETPRYMEQLVAWTNLQLTNKTLPALIVIGMFVAAFLAIHPFTDGNGRLSRALTTLLLLRAGYVYVPYCSLERIFEASKTSYYISLRATQKTLQSDHPSWTIWLTFFLKSLVKEVRHLKRKVDNAQLLRTMPDISMRMIELIRKHGAMSITEAAAILQLNKFTLRDHVKRLVKEQLLLRVGKGRTTKYALAI